MSDALVIPESNSWADFVWPEWVPLDLRKSIEEFWLPAWHRGPRQWAARSAYSTAPDFGERITLCDFREIEHTGRYVHAWNNIGRLVLDDGTYVCVGEPPRHGPWPRAEVSTEKSRKLAHVGTVIATTYRLRPVGDTRSGDWCHATIDDEYWTLSITSDHGNWSYRWNTETRRTLTAAIASDFGTDYMACKLCPDRSKYDPDETEKGCKLRIIEARRDGDLTREEAREAWRGLEDVGWDDERQTYDDLGNVLPAWLFRDDTSEYLKQSATGAFLHLRDAYLPALIDALRALPGPTPDPLPGTDKTNG